jgi:glutamine synthetase
MLCSFITGSLSERVVANPRRLVNHLLISKGDVFTPQLIDRWIGYKREKEIQPLRMRPHPLEFSMYFDI